MHPRPMHVQLEKQGGGGHWKEGEEARRALASSMVRFLSRGNSLEKLLNGSRRRTSSAPEASGDANCSVVMGEDRTAGNGCKASGRSSDGGWAADRAERVPKPRLARGNTRSSTAADSHHSDMALMKERFAKLLLGEDMSGAGKGVSSALALSNAITNLAASVFGEQRRLEPMSSDRKARWRKEIDWLLSVTDHIVELVPSQQTSKDGTEMEIMTKCQRIDLLTNIPALRKLDAMLTEYLENFKDQQEFWYVKRDEDESEEGNAQRNDDKWWLPTVKVPSNGLSDVSRRWLQFQKESVNQVLKAAMAINAQVLSEMEIPENYIDSLPKNGRASLGDAIYRSITLENFDPGQFLSTLDLSTEHKILDLKNKIEASVVIWQRKMNNKDGKASWSSTVSMEKRELFEERAETILVLLKQRFPGIPQSTLDINKIQYNTDVGQAVLESYSRILESLAYTIMSQIQDVLDADSSAQDPLFKNSQKMPFASDSESMTRSIKFLNLEEDKGKLNSAETPTSMTLSDVMGWHLDEEPDSKKDPNVSHDLLGFEDMKLKKLQTEANENKKFSYIEKLGGLRSPTSRH